MAGYFMMTVKVVSKYSPRANGTFGSNSAISAAAYIDAQKYENNVAHAAAYISGNTMKSITGEVSDYRNKQGVEKSFIILSDNAPQEYLDPQVLWNSVEAVETASNADLYREWIICFDKHLSYEQRYEIAKRFAESLVAEGMAAAHVAMHGQKDGNGNFHVHILAPTRGLHEDGTWQKYKVKPREYILDKEGNRVPVIDAQTGEQKVDSRGRKYWKRTCPEFINSWNDRKAGNVQRWRETFCKIENEFLPEEYKVSPKSYKEQGIDRLPGKHLGKVAFNIHKKLQAQVKGLPPEVRKEYLRRIDLLLLQKNDSPEWQAEHDALQAELQASLKEVSRYTPQKEQVKSYREKRKQVQLEEAFLEIERFRRLQHTNNLQQEVAEESLELVEKVIKASEDLMIMYSGVMTAPMEQHLIQGEFDIKKALFEETEKEITEIEQHIEELKEGGEEEYAREMEQLLAQCRESLQRARDVGTFGPAERDNSEADEGILKTATRISKLSTELRRHHREMEEAGRRVAESTGREMEGRGATPPKAVTKGAGR